MLTWRKNFIFVDYVINLYLRIETGKKHNFCASPTQKGVSEGAQDSCPIIAIVTQEEHPGKSRYWAGTEQLQWAKPHTSHFIIP